MSLRLIVLALTLISFYGCKDDFSLEGDFQDVPNVYAFLDAEDDRHFVRVQKAFLEASGNANLNAGIADSIYYGENDAMVILTNITRDDSIELSRVDGEQFGLTREAGTFATSPNILYTFEDDDIDLRGGDEIRLSIRRPGETDATATTNLLSPMTIVRPREQLVRIDQYQRQQSFSWSVDENARAFAIDITFKITEFNLSNPDLTQQIELDWEVTNEFIPTDGDLPGGNPTFRLENETFYRFLGENLSPKDGIRRRFDGFDLTVTGAGQEIVERRALANANSGITSSQVTPTYSSVTGGRGIVTSTTAVTLPNIQIDNSSSDSLRNGIYTRDLSF